MSTEQIEESSKAVLVNTTVDTRCLSTFPPQAADAALSPRATLRVLPDFPRSAFPTLNNSNSNTSISNQFPKNFLGDTDNFQIRCRRQLF